MAHPEGFEPPTPRFVVWLRALIFLENFANQVEFALNEINGLPRLCKPNCGHHDIGEPVFKIVANGANDDDPAEIAR